MLFRRPSSRSAPRVRNILDQLCQNAGGWLSEQRRSLSTLLMLDRSVCVSSSLGRFLYAMSMCRPCRRRSVGRWEKKQALKRWGR